MMDWITELAQNRETPALAAFFLGLLTAIAPCPLATNVTATAYIARNVSKRWIVLWGGVLYTVGRMFSYTVLSAAIYFGASSFQIARIFQGHGEKYIGFVLIVIGLVLLDVIPLRLAGNGSLIDRLSERFRTWGVAGAFFLGALFALAFCPYSGALFFAMLIPMMLSAEAGLVLPVLFSAGTGLPVLVFAFVIAFSMEKLGTYFAAIARVERFMRIASGVVFIVTGLYYINLFFGPFV